MKEQQITQKYKNKEFSYTAKIPETTDEFAELLQVNCLDFAVKEYLFRLKDNLKGKLRDKKFKINEKAKIQDAVDNFRLVMVGGEAKKELKGMFKGMSEAEAKAAAEAVAKMRQNGETTEETATDQPTANGE